ncbi:hypothetical protein, partial [Escherichia coli]|uniref:hypothetical protein n=1 Tax=Escherichia coli TaxID=562 RepID=UPI001BFDE9DE
ATLQLIIVTGSVFVKSHQARWVLFDCSLLFLVLSGGFSLTPNLTQSNRPAPVFLYASSIFIILAYIFYINKLI